MFHSDMRVWMCVDVTSPAVGAGVIDGFLGKIISTPQRSVIAALTMNTFPRQIPTKQRV